MSATSAPICSSHGEQAEVGVQARGRRVVVAGADVHVVAHAVALAAHDEHALGVRLQRGQAVDDVHARLLQRVRPVDVRALVEARLELDQADRLLAALGRADQRRDERRVVARAVHGLLDREHVRVGDRLLDEALDRGGERVVGVVDEQVALAHRARARRAARPRRRCRRGWVTGVHGSSRSSRVAGQLHDLPQVLEVEQAVDLVDVVAPRPPSARSICSRIAPGSCRRRPRPARPRRSAGGAARPRPPAAGRRPRRRP